MTIPAFHDLRLWGMGLSLVLHLAAGGVLGALYFGSLWWSTERFVEGGGLLRVVVATLGRFALLGGILLLTSLEGAMPLLATALGILVARHTVMRGFERAPA